MTAISGACGVTMAGRRARGVSFGALNRYFVGKRMATVIFCVKISVQIETEAVPRPTTSGSPLWHEKVTMPSRKDTPPSHRGDAERAAAHSAYIGDQLTDSDVDFYRFWFDPSGECG